MNLDDTFHSNTTLITTEYDGTISQGSGFFYQVLGEQDEKNSKWTSIKEVWLVTNRHVLLPKNEGKEVIPNKITFNLRRVVNDKVSWIPIELTQNEFVKRAKFHENPNIDVGIISILDLFTDLIKNEPKNEENSRTSIMNIFAVSSEKLPGKNKLHVQVTDDIITIGYPRGFYDSKNIFPIIKGGIIASRWGMNFDGEPCFLIDTKLFPGSSGSLVLTKPNDVVVEDGKIFCSKEKQFAFLGIYSGEPIINRQPIETDDMIIQIKEGFNVGKVWYGFLVDDIIKDGKSIK